MQRDLGIFPGQIPQYLDTERPAATREAPRAGGLPASQRQTFFQRLNPILSAYGVDAGSLGDAKAKTSRLAGRFAKCVGRVWPAIVTGKAGRDPPYMCYFAPGCSEYVP